MEWKFIKNSDYVINNEGEIITRRGKGSKAKVILNSKGEEMVQIVYQDKSKKRCKVKDLIEEYFGPTIEIELKENKPDRLKDYDFFQWEVKCNAERKLKIYAKRLGKEYGECINDLRKEKILIDCLGYCIERTEPLVFNNSKEVSDLLKIDELVVLGTALGLNENVRFYYKGLSMCLARGKVFDENFPNLNIDNYTYNDSEAQKRVIEVMRKCNIAYTVWFATKDDSKVEDLTTYRDFTLLNADELRKKYSIYFK